MPQTNIGGSALSHSGNAIKAGIGAQANEAKQLGKSMANGTKREVTIFSDQVVGGVAVADTAMLNSAQGNIIDGRTEHCLAVGGQGGVVVRDAEGKIGVMRSVFSQGTNAQNEFVAGDASRADAPKIMGWRVDEAGQRLEANTSNILKNNNDLGQLVPVTFKEYETFAEASTKVTLDNMLNASFPVNTATTAPTTGDLQQTVTFFNELGGKHTLTVSWRRVLAGDGSNNNAAPDADSTRIVVDGTTYDNCDVWKMAVQYTDHTGATQFAQFNDGADKAFDFANSPRMFFKGGKMVGLANTANNTALGIAKMYDANIPFTAEYNPVSLDLGITTTANTNGHSKVITAATTAQLNAAANGSELVQMSGWLVDSSGMVQVQYPTKSRPVYQIPIGTFASVNSVAVSKGIWYPVSDSGALQLSVSGKGEGTLNPGKEELSTVDTTDVIIGSIPLSELIAAASKMLATAIENRKTILNAF